MEKEEIINLIREVIHDELKTLIANDRYTFQKRIQIFDTRDIEFGTVTGTKIGTATTQKLAFYGATPVDRPATISDPSGGAVQDSGARGAIETIIDRLQELGLIA